MLIEEHIKGTISIPVHEGDSYHVIEHSFTEDDIIQNSCSITSRCCDDKTFSIGGVRPAELSIKLRIDIAEVNSYTLYGAKIRLYSAYHTVPVPDDKWLLRGEFWVTSVSRTKTIYSLKASDAIIWLDSGSYLEGQTQTKDDPIYNICSSAIRTLDANIVNGVISKVNEYLRSREIDEIKYCIRPDITNNHPFVHGDTERYGYAILPKDESGSHGVQTTRDYVKWAAELAAGCAQMITLPDSPDICRLCITPFGYKPYNVYDGHDDSVISIWENPIKISYDSIELDSCDIADYELFIQKEYMETYDGTKWSNGCGFAKYKGNITLDFTNNMFLSGRHYNNKEHAYPWGPMIAVGEQLNCVKKRPFSLKCHPMFTDLAQLPKLGQAILIEEKPEIWTESFITKMVWKFRSGWEFGCAGSDSRVLSQAAKRSLASHAEERAKAYANIVAKSAGESISEVRDTAYYAKSTADSVNNAWNTYMPDVWNRLAALESKVN